MSDPFYITLPSHSNKKEFPNNKANHYKIRLPQTIRLEGSGWQVGLSAISLPDAANNLDPFKELTKPEGQMVYGQEKEWCHNKR